MLTRPRLILAVVVATLVSACGLGNAIDCQSICNRYMTCFDASYDVAACAARCRSESAKDADYERRADVCNACLDERSCTSATFNCATSCAGIVP